MGLNVDSGSYACIHIHLPSFGCHRWLNWVDNIKLWIQTMFAISAQHRRRKTKGSVNNKSKWHQIKLDDYKFNRTTSIHTCVCVCVCVCICVSVCVRTFQQVPGSCSVTLGNRHSPFPSQASRRHSMSFYADPWMKERSLLHDNHQKGEKMIMIVKTPGSHMGSPAAAEVAP